MNWPVSKLSEVAEIIAGQSPPSYTYNDTGEGLPFFQGKADFGEMYPQTRIWCSAPKKLAEPNDVLLSVRAPVGPTNLCRERSCIGRGLSALRPGSKLDGKYLLHYLRYIEPRLSGQGRGSTFSAITQSEIRNLKIPLPPLPEQKRIAAILDKADELRRKRCSAIAKLDTLTQSIFLDMFGDPVTNPKGWQVSPLVSVTLRDNGMRRGPFGGAIKKDMFVSSGYKVYEQGNVIYNDFERGHYYISEDGYQKLIKFAVSPGDVLISCSGTIGKSAIVPKNAQSGIINQALLKISVDETAMHPLLFKSIWDSAPFQRHVLGAVHGTGMQNMPPIGEIKTIPLPVPHMNIQQRYLAWHEALSRQKNRVAGSEVALEGLFTSVQQQVFSGAATMCCRTEQA